MLEVRGLVAGYGAVRALGGVDMSVAEGSVTAVLGANGAGKTTLLRTVSGLLRPRSGSVELDGRDLTRAPVEEIVRLGVAHVPQSGGVITELTVRDNLRLGGLWRRDRAGLARRVAEMYELFPPLAERRDRLAATLSGGERQMLALARALTGGPRLLLVDEPSLGLAPKVVASLMAVLRRLCDEDGRTVLLVEQNARSALSVADRAVVLDLGSVVASEPAATLAADDRLRHAYLGF
ncbi:ABC transporter ATP-binding protein [Actinomadura fibrosa]|uniref:ABC transporter ATP-binding protein n=1 Tax=Actinomadura fibrosa TaxID=111802 RepID=A0ABW2XS80_9ACTN|nr:ABC transporter ATP-binding protein [Actinomadura fibrosa]